MKTVIEMASEAVKSNDPVIARNEFLERFATLIREDDAERIAILEQDNTNCRKAVSDLMDELSKREKQNHSGEATDMVAEQERAPITEPVVPWLSHKVVEQAEQEPVGDNARDNMLLRMIQHHFPSLPVSDEYTDWGRWLRFANAAFEAGRKDAANAKQYPVAIVKYLHIVPLQSSERLEPDTLLYATPIRTKDLTDDEIFNLNECESSADIAFARAVIAADRYRPWPRWIWEHGQMNYGRDNLMVIAAHRYCLGRSTYIVGDCVEWLIAIWDTLPRKTKEIIQRDTEEAFERDDGDRADGRDYKALGHDCDRAEWLKLRQLWSGKK